MTPEQIQRLRELSVAATWGPSGDFGLESQCPGSTEDIEWIVAVRDALPELLDDWERMQAERLTLLHDDLKRIRKAKEPEEATTLDPPNQPVKES